MSPKAYLEEDIVEAPSLGGQDGGETLLTLLDEESKVDGTRASITSSPGLARTSVWSVAVGSERLTINPRLRDGVDGLITVKTQELGDDGGGGDLNEDDVIETNSVEGVEQGKSTLDFVCLDHGLQDVTDSQRLALTSKVISDSENGSEVVRGMTP